MAIGRAGANQEGLIACRVKLQNFGNRFISSDVAIYEEFLLLFKESLPLLSGE
jgi:hypothetical protein